MGRGGARALGGELAGPVRARPALARRKREGHQSGQPAKLAKEKTCVVVFPQVAAQAQSNHAPANVIIHSKKAVLSIIDSGRLVHIDNKMIALKC